MITSLLRGDLLGIKLNNACLFKDMPNIIQNIYMCKKNEYQDEFLGVAEKFTETQFYIGSK